jgi:hypothetical protein
MRTLNSGSDTARSRLKPSFGRGHRIFVAILGGLLMASVGRSGSSSRLQASEPGAVDGSQPVTYTAQQAERGEALFRRHCQFCHFTSPANAKTALEPARGIAIASSRGVMNLGGHEIVEKFPSVYHIYRRIRDNMPTWDIDAASPQQKVDIVAFLLRENGVPAGGEELPLDVEAMRRMRLAKGDPWAPEPGFELLFNGKDFTNFKFLFGPNCAPPPGCGTTEPDAFSINDGVIVSHGRHHGYMYTERRFLNFDLRFDYRIVPAADEDLADTPIFTGGGFILFIDKQNVWPEAIEIEGDNDRMLHAYGLGKQITDTWDKEALLRANKGPGPWNSVQIKSKDGQVDVLLNGTLVTHVAKHSFGAGHIAIEYEGNTWMYRRIRIKPE